MAQYLKKTTGITGLKVLKDPRAELIHVYKTILKALNEMPDSAAYKHYTRNNINNRLQIVQNENDPLEIEKKINCGQCEELLVQAENELSLARRFILDRPWEPLVKRPPPDQWKWPL